MTGFVPARIGNGSIKNAIDGKWNDGPPTAPKKIATKNAAPKKAIKKTTKKAAPKKVVKKAAPKKKVVAKKAVRRK